MRWDAERWLAADRPDTIVHADDLALAATLPDGVARLIYLDPPFNTGRTQRHRPLRTVRDPDGARRGFQGRSYAEVRGALSRYDDGAHIWMRITAAPIRSKKGGIAGAVLAIQPIHQAAQQRQQLLDRIAERLNWASISFLLEGVVFLLIGLQARWIIGNAGSGSLGWGRVIAVCAEGLHVL